MRTGNSVPAVSNERIGDVAIWLEVGGQCGRVVESRAEAVKIIILCWE